MSESRSRIGILGAGHLGRIHLQQALAIPELEVIGFHDPDPARCVAVQAELGVPALGSVEAVIRAADLVDVVTPTLNHHACAMQAMDLIITSDTSVAHLAGALGVTGHVQTHGQHRGTPAQPRRLSATDRHQTAA